jgi:hypothetical protein
MREDFTSLLQAIVGLPADEKKNSDDLSFDNINVQKNSDASAMATSTVRRILMPRQWQHQQSEEF